MCSDAQGGQGCQIPPASPVTISCELPDVGAGNPAQVLWKAKQCVLLTTASSLPSLEMIF